MEELVKNEILFYAKIAKPLVLNLPKSKDRILAAAWIKKFGQETAGTEKLRTSYLKLLLFCLQRRRLTGIFADDPSQYEFLEELPEEVDLNEFARNLLEQEASERKAVVNMEMMGDMENFPTYTTDCSPDLTEYVAAQDIPNFGVHAYYAISKQPVNKWQRADKAILPKGTKSSIDTSLTSSPAGATSICVCTPKGTASAPQVEEGAAIADCLQPRDKTRSKDQKKKRRPQKFGTSPPTHPIGEVKRSTEDRLTPTWGTNLLEVRENTDIGHIEEPSDAAKALDKEVSELVQEEEEEEAAAGAAPPAQETVASKAKDMLNTIDEFSHGKMAKPKKKRPARLGDTSGIKTPKSLREPKISVKGMKKKVEKKGIGPRPANLPEEYADWTEQDLEAAGLTWKDLLPMDESIDDELEKIEEEEMRHSREENLDIEEIAYTPYEGLDLEAMLREAEADLAATVYETGAEADENAIELLANEMYDIQDEINASAASEEARAASPAITSGIPVTTPQRSASPKRSKSPETAFDGDDDALLRHRDSPLRPPRISDKRRKKRSARGTPPQTDKDPNISKVYERVHTVSMDDSFLEHERDFEEMEEFERLEGQFQQETASPRRSPAPVRGVSFLPGEDRARQRAWEQEQLLRTPQASSPPRQIMRTPERADRVMDQFDLGGMSPFSPAASPPHMTQQEQNDMLMSFAEPSQDSSLGLLSPSAFQSPQTDLVPTALPPLLPGSPIANRIIDDATDMFTDNPFATRSEGYLDDVTPPSADISFMSASPGPSDYHTADPDESLGLIHSWEMPDNLISGEDVDDTMIFERFRQDASTREPPRAEVIRAPSPARSPIRQPSPERSPIRQPCPARSPMRQPSPERSPMRQPSPARSPIRQPSPERSPIQQPCPARSPMRQPSPERSPMRQPSPAHSPMRQPSPARSPAPCPARSPIRAASPIRTTPARSARPAPRQRVAMDDSFLEHERDFQEMDEFERLESQFQQETASPRRSPCPALEVPFSPGEADRARQRAWEQEQLLRTPPRQIIRTPERADRVMDQFDLGGMSPFSPAASPPHMTQQEQNDMLMSFAESSGGSLGLLSPSVFQSPPESPDDDSLGLLSPSVFQSPPIRDYLDDVTPPCDLSFMSASPDRSDYHTADESLGLIQSWEMSDDLVPGGDEDDRTIMESFRASTRGAPPIEVLRAHSQIRGPSAARRPTRQPCPARSPIRAPTRIPPSPQPVPSPPPMPFFPGISAPITPIFQRPLRRTSWYKTPPPTPPKQYGPERGPMTPSRVRPPPLQVTPRRPRQASKPTRLFGTPYGPGTPSRSPAELEEFEHIESDLRAVSPSQQAARPILSLVDVTAQEAVARIQEVARRQEALLRMPESPRRRTKKIGRYPSTPTSDEEFEQLEKQLRAEDSPCAPCSPAREASPMGGIPPDVTGERARQQEERLLRPSPIRSPSPVLDRRKVISTPPRPPKYVPPQPPVQLWKTPEGVAGPSRRPTGFTPPVVCPSDCTPSPSPVLSPMFPPARRIIKKGVYSPSLMTPTGERHMPSPQEESAQRLPLHGTPGRGDPRMIPRRLFDTPSRRPRVAAEESPIQYSPSPVCSPIVYPYQFDVIKTLDSESPPAHMPPTPPPLLQEGQLYFPGQEVLPTATPEQLPTWDDIEQHQVIPDYLHAQISQRTPFGRGPGRYMHRESVRAFPPMDLIPEYATDVDPDHVGYCPAKVPKYYEPLPRDFPSPRPQSPMDYTPPYTDTIQDILTASPPPERCPASYYPDVVQSTQDFIRAVEQYDLPCEPCTGGAPARPPRPSGLRPPRPSGLRPPPPSGLRRPSGTPLHPSGLRPPSGTPQQALPQFGPHLATPDETGRPTVLQAAPVKTASTSSVAEPGRQRSLFGKIKLKETKSTLLRKEALAKQKAAELEVKKKKEKAEQARKKKKTKLQKERLREIVEQQSVDAEADAARETPGSEFMDLLQQHEVDFPDMRRSVVVKGRWKRVPRRSETGFQQMDEVQEEPGSPCEPCSGGDVYQDTIRDLRLFDRPQPQMRPQVQLTPQQEQMRLHEIEQNVIAREREELEYFEQMQQQQRLDQIEQNVIEREREEAEYFEQMRREEEMHGGVSPQPCPAAGLSPVGPVDRLTYSPPRPQSVFGRPPFQFPGQHLPPPCAPCTPPGGTLDAQSPPMYESPPPMFDLLEAISPPAFFDEDFGTPSPQGPQITPSPQRRQVTPSPQRRQMTPSPQRPHITPPLEPQRVREEIDAMARPEFDPGLRGDLLPRDQRRVITCPGGFQAMREEEPMIPDLPSPPRQDPHIRRRKELERIKRRKRPRTPSPDNELSRFLRNTERDWELAPEHTPEGAALMDRTPPRRRLRSPMATYQSPPVRAPCQASAADPGRLYPFTPPEHQEFYVPPAGAPIHPDLVGLDLRTPMRVPQDAAGIMEEAPDESLYFTPPQYPEYFEELEREREREAVEQWQPPRALRFEHMPSPGELGLLTPPSCGIGTHRETYTPEGTPSLGLIDESMLDSVAQGIVSPPLEGLLDMSLLDNVDQGWITTPPVGGGPTEQEIQDFLEPVPILEHPGSIQELRHNVERAQGRAGIRPQPMYFGGYGETPKRYIPRWYGHGGVRNLIRELDEVASPPTPGTPPPQFPEPPPTWSPDLDEYERLEREMDQCVRREPEFEERRRRMIIDDMAEAADRSEMARRDAMRREAERQNMQFRQPYSPVITGQVLSPPRTPTGLPPAEFACDTGTCAEPEPIQTYVSDQGWPAGFFSPRDSESRRQQEASRREAERLEMEFGQPYSPIMTGPQILSCPGTPTGHPPAEYETYAPGARLPPGMFPPVVARRRQDEADAQRWIGESGYNPPLPELRTPEYLSDNVLDFFLSPPQLSPWEQLNATAARTPNLLDDAVLDDYQSPPPISPRTPQNLSDYVLDYYESPPQLSPCEQMASAAARTPEMLDDVYLEDYQSPPPMSELGSPLTPCAPPRGTTLTPGQRAALEAQQDREIREMFGASPTPVSPGPGPDFLDNVYSHQVPMDFSVGARPPCAVRDQRGRRDVMVHLPRHTPGPAFDPIMEQRVRIQSPEMVPQEMVPVSRPRRARPILQAPIRAGEAPAASASAQRIADARRHYQQVTRGSRSQQQQQAASTSCASRICAAAGPQQSFGGLVPRQVQQRQPAPQQVEAEAEGPRRVVRKTSSIKKIQTKRK